MDWAWLLVFVGLMFVMHRFGLGCCGGHSHGGHAGHGHDTANGGEERDKTRRAALQPEVSERKGDG